MKNFVIFDKSTLRKLTSYSNEYKSNFDGLWGDEDVIANLELGELDPDTVKCVSFQDTETIVLQPEQQIPIFDSETGEQTGVEIVPAVTEDREFTNYRLEVDQILVQTKSENTKNELIAKAREQMDTDILEFSKTIYGSMSAEAMLSWEAQWTRMANSPEAFIGKFGLTTAEEVAAYAQNKINTVSIPAGIYRLERIEQFQAERSAILNS